MALATRCPHCQTTFRVAHDQLKLRAGLVRCGACKEIFNGVEHLLPTGVPAPISRPPDAGSSSTTASSDRDAALGSDRTEVPTSAPQSGSAASVTPDFSSSEQSVENHAAGKQVDTTAYPPAPDIPSNPDPLQRMTLMDFSAWKEDEAGAASASAARNTIERSNRESDPDTAIDLPSGAPDEVEQAIDDLQRRPWRRRRIKRHSDDDIEGDDDATEPEFVKHARRQQQFGRIVRLLMIMGSAILLIALVGQAVYTFRDQIAARFPQTAPILSEACLYVGCHVGLPSQIESVSIESSELQSLSSEQNTFVLNALLRNRGVTPQAWPSIELTLNEANGKTIARRVFSPREYLSPQPDSGKGLAPNSEHLVKVHFELSELKASGYRLYLFYP